ncbi:MAG TPA: hypothetical protein V6C85_15465 [Allocoleopsis sp.]
MTTVTLTSQQIRQQQREIKELLSTVESWKPRLECIAASANSQPNF